MRTPWLQAALALYLSCSMTACKSPPRPSGQSSGQGAEPRAPEAAEVPKPGSVPAGERPGDRAEARWHYHLRPSADLGMLDARICFAGRVPRYLDAQITEARGALVAARLSRQGTDLAMKADGLDLGALAPGDCVDMTLDLERLGQASRHRGIRRFGRDLLFSPDYWLWQPSGSLGDAIITATFDLPGNMALALPWPRESPEGPYRIPMTTFLWATQGALGDLSPEILDIGGARLRVFLLGDSWKVDTSVLLSWLDRAARAVSLLYGEFPVPEAQIILVPVPGKRVGFGWATQGGGASVAIMVGVESTAEGLASDWVAVHEMLHLGMPVLHEDSNWLAEGIVTYYEPLLRARAGLMSARDAWESLHEGFGRGRSRGSGRTLRSESEDMDKTHEYWRVYWSGAAIALITDVSLRRQGASLDQEMQRIRACCLAGERTLTAKELLARSAVPGRPGATALPSLGSVSGPYLDQATFPDVSPAYRALGLSFDEHARLTVSDDPLATRLREAMTAPPP